MTFRWVPYEWIESILLNWQISMSLFVFEVCRNLRTRWRSSVRWIGAWWLLYVIIGSNLPTSTSTLWTTRMFEHMPRLFARSGGMHAIDITGEGEAYVRKNCEIHMMCNTSFWEGLCIKSYPMIPDEYWNHCLRYKEGRIYSKGVLSLCYRKCKSSRILDLSDRLFNKIILGNSLQNPMYPIHLAASDMFLSSLFCWPFIPRGHASQLDLSVNFHPDMEYNWVNE